MFKIITGNSRTKLFMRALKPGCLLDNIYRPVISRALLGFQTSCKRNSHTPSIIFYCLSCSGSWVMYLGWRGPHWIGCQLIKDRLIQQIQFPFTLIGGFTPSSVLKKIGKGLCCKMKSLHSNLSHFELTTWIEVKQINCYGMHHLSRCWSRNRLVGVHAGNLKARKIHL